ncbi:MAG: methyltransferase domain-containing protein [Chloroflexota bacterium]|nr:methyltransferase domain-containing protein [Chloroflexota bacterium]
MTEEQREKGKETLVEGALREKIEILSVELLTQHRPLVNELKSLARSLNLDFGWHYLLDLTWIINNLGTIQDRRILDAGAGTGVIQWYLAEQGATVISADRVSRADLPLRFRRRFRVSGYRTEDLLPTRQLIAAQYQKPSPLRVKVSSLARDLTSLANTNLSSGQVMIYNQDLTHLSEIDDNSIDAVAAVSALEHNTPEVLGTVAIELKRVLKPGGVLLATLGAARDQDWYHEPSSGWCYTDASLRQAFGLAEDAPSNYDHYDELFTKLMDCTELRKNLARFYFQSGDNGMPWGQWDPQYQPVGVFWEKLGIHNEYKPN